jgi:NapC/NirT cytochrome c family, N-terminal region
MKLMKGRQTMMGAVGMLLAGGIGLALLGAGGIVAWEYSNSDAFCANVCHAVHPEESRIHPQSVHARVQCVECHMGRTSTLHLMALKPTHFKELWGMVVGYERPVTSSTLRPARENCESCHWPSAVHRDTLAIKKRYETDAASSETQTRLVLHTGFGAVREKDAKGVHWHIDNDVEFISLDPQRRTIPWVQVRKPDGSKVTYIDSSTKVTAQELTKHEARRIECFDCHNTVGHPLRNPADAVDDAIADGRIDRSLPSAKARAVSLIAAAGDMSGTQAERVSKIDKLVNESAAKAGGKPEDKDKEAKFAATMKRILLDTTFEAPGITWKTFPDHAGHKDSSGCFRCHDGKHFNDKGEAIRLQCTLCHDLPQVKREKGAGSVASTVAPGLVQPASHGEPNFMHDHRLKLDPSCAMCHGKIQFGREGGNFCSNPACHGRTWPDLNLNVQPSG